MRVLLCGDIHGDYEHARYLFRTAKENEVSLIISLGDFGFFPGRKWSDDFLNRLNKLSKQENIPVWWLDGNHENHDVIDVMVENHEERPIITTSLTQQWDNLFYLPRGYVFELDGISFMSYGGAYSIDRSVRVKFTSWFPQEVIDLDHIHSLSDDHVDILLSHDAPLGYELNYSKFDAHYQSSSENSSALLELCKKITPRYCFAGHHHTNHKYEIEHHKGITTCYILNCNMTVKRSWAMLDTEQMKESL